MNKQEQERYESFYEEMLRFSRENHEKNKKRIAIGIKCLIIIPIILLILMFNVTENKMAFLGIWIISVLLITAILIMIEYRDHQVQKKIAQLSGTEEKIKALTEEQMELMRQRTKKMPKSSSTFIRIFKHDMNNILHNVVAIVILIGLICLPCIYCWTNLLSSWSPYTDLNAIKIGVYSKDEGFYVGDNYINIGNTVVESLRENDTVGWVFYEEEKAVDDVYEGNTYAAFVIPEDFSEKLIDFMKDDLAHPTIEYYENQKKNSIVPKITSKVKTTVQGQVNETIITEVSKVVAKAGGSLTGEGTNLTATTVQTLRSLSEDLNSYINVLSSFIYITQSAGAILDSSGDLLPDFDSIVQNGQNTIHSMESILVSGNNTVNQVGNTIDAAMYMIDIQMNKLKNFVYQDMIKVENVAGTVQNDVTLIQNQIQLLHTMIDSWKELNKDANQNAYYEKMEESLSGLVSNLDSLKTLAQTSEDDVTSLKNDLIAKLELCDSDLQQVKQVYQNSLKQEIKNTVNSLYTSLIEAGGLLSNINIDFSSVCDNLETYGEELQTGTVALTDSKAMAEHLLEKLDEVILYLDDLQGNEQYQSLANLLENNPEQFADFVAEPTAINQVVLYEISDAVGNSYASSMSSFYTVLSLYLSSLFCMVMIHAEFKRKNYKEIKGKISRFHQYLGRWMTFACVSIATSTILALGDLFFIEVQCKHPVAFVCSVIVVGLVFNLFAYSCAFGLGLVGEAMALLFMILSVCCSSSFPFDLLPSMFGVLDSFLLILFQPGMNMLKETIAGYNGVDYWIYFAQQMIYIAASVCIALGISRIPFIHWICEIFEKKKNDSHVLL